MVLITSRYCCYLDPLASGRLDGFSGDPYPLSTDLDPLASGRLDRMIYISSTLASYLDPLASGRLDVILQPLCNSTFI